LTTSRHEVADGDRFAAVGARVARTEPTAEEVAVGAAPLAEVTLLALRALVDDELHWQLDRRLGRGSMPPAVGVLPAGS
jgi:hypothetical protein